MTTKEINKKGRVMKRLLLSLCISSVVSASLYADTTDTNTFEYKNETLRVRVSKDSVNRIVLPAPVTGKILSVEKNINVQINGKEAYVKIIPVKKTELVGNKVTKQEIDYTDTEAEVFFLTDKRTYSIVFVPDKIETRTVYITDNSLIKDEALKVEKNSTEYSKNIKNIFKLAINNELENSFTEIVKNEKHNDFYFVSQYDGVNFVMYKFFLKDASNDEILEKINKSIKNQIVAFGTFENNYYALGARDE